MIREGLRYLRTAVISLTGAPGKRRDHRNLVSRLPGAAEQLSGFGEAARLETGGQPVFLFAPTWRCGSTLVQRLVMSSGSVWMWGEVYTQAEPLQQMVGMFRPFRDDFPDPGLFGDPEAEARDLTGDWIARLSPEPRHLLEAHRAFWDRLCSQPASDRGYERWGLKAVNLSVAHPIYLKRLYPDARLLFLVRNPFRAWLSYRRFASWYASFPDDPVFTVQRFARMWGEHVEQFLPYADREPDALLLRLEDLVEGGETLAELADHVGAPLDASVLARTVSGTGSRSAGSTTLVERLVIQRIAGEPARRLGYTPV